MKYYIKMINRQFGTVKYKRYKCIDGFSEDKTICWKFSKAGGLKIIEDLKREYYRNIRNLEFQLEEA